tara:strand:+ start:1120 stop:1317 length:198 start_codon:yes stop_codon:yes gene_type:complete
MPKNNTTIPTAFGHFDDLIKTFVKGSGVIFDELVKPELPKQKKQQLGKKFNTPFLENESNLDANI